MVDCINASVLFLYVSGVKANLLEIVLIALSSDLEENLVLPHSLSWESLARQGRRVNIESASNKEIFVATDEVVLFGENQLIEKSVLIDGNFPFQVYHFKDIAADQSNSISARSYLSDRNLLPGKNGLVKQRPVLDSVFVKFSAVDVQLLLSSIIVDDVAAFH